MNQMNKPLSGILYMIAGLGLLACMDAAMKWLTADYNVLQIVFARGFFGFIPVLTFAWFTQGGVRQLIRWKHPKQLTVRAIISFFAFTSMVYAFSLMPLAEAVSISFSIPLFIILLSYFFLKENMTFYRWLALIGGFIGMMIIVRPGVGVFQMGAIYAVIGSVFFATFRVVTRAMGDKENTLVMSFTAALAWCALGSIFLFGSYAIPTQFDFVIFMMVGILGGLAEILITHGSRIAPASLLAPFHYTLLVWAIFFGYLIWGDLPTGYTLFGASIVIISSIFLARKEAR